MPDENLRDDDTNVVSSPVSASERGDATPVEGDSGSVERSEADAVSAEVAASAPLASDSAHADAPATQPRPQYGVGPFSVREVAVLALWAVAFLVSFFSFVQIPFRSVWMSGIDWVLPIGVPTIAVFLIVLRRFSPDGIRRVGSLGIDQFASVAFSVASVVWLSYIWNTIAAVIAGAPWYTTWVVWVEFVVFLGLVLLSVFAPYISPFAEDFRGRPRAEAHRNARGIRAVIARPRPEPAPVLSHNEGFSAAAGDGSARATGGYPVESAEPSTGDTGVVDAGAWSPTPAYSAGAGNSSVQREDDTASPAVSRPFWALAPVERDVVDEHTGAPVFRIGPTAWALVIADRGSSFVVQHEDGRVGVLYDVAGVTRG